MQVFKTFFRIIYKNKLPMLIYAGIFFGLTLMLSFATKEKERDSFSSESLNIALENRDTGVLGETLIQYLDRNHEIQQIPAEKEELLDAMYYEEIEYVLEIPEDFTEKFTKGERKGLLKGTMVPGSSSSYLAEQEMNQFLSTLALYVDGGYAQKEAAEQALEDMENQPEIEFLEGKDGSRVEDAFYYFQFLPYIFLSITIVGMGIVLLEFNKKEIDARNKCSSMTFTSHHFQLVLGSIGLMLLEYGIFIFGACVLYPDYMFSVKGFLSAVNALAFLLVALSIGFLAGHLMKNQEEISMFGTVAGLGLSFLGGVFVSLEIMGDGMQKAAKFVPTYWYITASESIQKVKSFADAGKILPNFLILVVFAAAILSVTLVLNRVRSRS